MLADASSGAPLPNDGIPFNSSPGGCILSNGLPFTYFAVGNSASDIALI